MFNKLKKVKTKLKALGLYFLNRLQSDEYFDYALWRKVKFRTYMWLDLKYRKSATMFQHINIDEKLVGRNGRVFVPREVLAYPDKATFLKYKKGNVVAIYTLRKKKNNPKLAFLYSRSAEVLMVVDSR